MSRLLPLPTALFLLAIGASPAPTTRPTSHPTAAEKKGDPALDFLLGSATAAPALPAEDPNASPRPTSRPVSPLANANAKDGTRRGFILLSNGEKIHGKIATTPGKPLRVWVEQAGEYRDLPFSQVKSAEAKLLWERDEKEWRFRESGSDIKDYSGRTYPARELEYTLTLASGETITGGIVAPLYLQTPERPVTFVLNKREKGEVGVALKDLVYVKRLEFEAETSAK